MSFQIKHISIALLIISFGVLSKAQESYTLKEALHTARINNPHLKTQQYDISIARTEIMTAELRPNPEFNNESLQLIKSSEFAPHTGWYRGQNRETFWQLSKPFQVAGQRKHKIEVANKNVSLAEKSYTETERNLFLEVADKWLDAWTAQKQLDIIQIAIDNIDSLLNTNKVRYRNQVITQTDLFRTELLAKQYAIQYKIASQEVKSRQKEMGFLLGAPDEIQVDTADQFSFAIAENIDSLLTQSLDNRSDIQSAKSLIDVSSSNIKLQKSLSYPKPELGLIYNPQGAVPFLGISFAIDLPLFDRNQGEIKKSYQLKEQAEHELWTIQQQIQTEIEVAYSNYQVQQQNLQDFKPLLEQSQTILDNVKHAYLRGGTTIIDFLEAQRSWLETQQQHYDALQSYRESYIQLLYATGLINQLVL